MSHRPGCAVEYYSKSRDEWIPAVVGTVWPDGMLRLLHDNGSVLKEQADPLCVRMISRKGQPQAAPKRRPKEPYECHSAVELLGALRGEAAANHKKKSPLHPVSGSAVNDKVKLAVPPGNQAAANDKEEVPGMEPPVGGFLANGKENVLVAPGIGATSSGAGAKVVVLDAPNILKHTNDGASAKKCDWSKLLQAAKYYQQRGYQVRAFLPRAGQWNRGSNEAKQFAEEFKIVLCPSGSCDDNFMIKYVEDLETENGTAAFIVTNDLFRDHIKKDQVTSEWVKSHTMQFAFDEAPVRFIPFR